MIYVGIDNGVTGSIGIINTINDDSKFLKVPTISQQDYTKKKGNITRLNVVKIWDIIEEILKYEPGFKIKVFIERPMINPTRWKASMSAIRCLESWLTIFELLEGIPHQFVDSKEWQKAMLPKGTKKEQLKIKSRDIGIRLFPQFKEQITKHKDADGLLIAEWARKDKC